MPVMKEQVRKARAERLLQLRSEGVSPAAAWRVVAPKSKAKDSQAAELCRREIKWYRGKYCVVDAPGEDGEPEDGKADGPNGAALNGAPAEITGDVAAKPVKRCLGVEDKPCGKEITGRSPRCDDCRKEHERLRKQRNNRNDHRRHGEERSKRQKAEKLAEEAKAALPRIYIVGRSCRISVYPDGRRELYDVLTKRSRWLNPDEPTPPPWSPE